MRSSDSPTVVTVRSRIADKPSFLERERKKWTCPSSGDVICVHTGVCSGCGWQYAGQMNR